MICSTNETQNFYISTLRSSECTSPTPSALCKLNDWPLYNSSLFVCLDKRKYIIYDVHDIFATSLSVKLFTITWSIPDKPYLCILTYLLNAQESRNMYFFKEWEYFHNKINFSLSSLTYYKDIVYPVCNETKLVISWLNCIFLEMAKPSDLWADTFINKF